MGPYIVQNSRATIYRDLSGPGSAKAVPRAAADAHTVTRSRARESPVCDGTLRGNALESNHPGL